MIGHSRTSVLRWLYFCIVTLAGIALAAAQSPICTTPSVPYQMDGILRYLTCGPSQYAAHPVSKCLTAPTTWAPVGLTTPLTTVADHACVDFVANTITIAMDSGKDHIVPDLAENFTISAPSGHTIKIELVASTATAFTPVTGCQFSQLVDSEFTPFVADSLNALVPEHAVNARGTIKLSMYCPSSATFTSGASYKIRAGLVKPAIAMLTAETNMAIYTVLSHGFQVSRLLIFDVSSNVDGFTESDDAAHYGIRHAPSAEAIIGNMKHTFKIVSPFASPDNDLTTLCPAGFAVSSSIGNCFASSTIPAPTSSAASMSVPVHCKFNFTAAQTAVPTKLSITCLASAGVESPSWRIALPAATSIVRQSACDISVFSATYSNLYVADPPLLTPAHGIEVTPLTATTARVSCGSEAGSEFSIFGPDTVTCNTATNAWSKTQFRCIKTPTTEADVGTAGTCASKIGALFSPGTSYTVTQTDYFSGALSFRVSCSSAASAYATPDSKASYVDALCYTSASGTGSEILMLDNASNLKCTTLTCSDPGVGTNGAFRFTPSGAVDHRIGHTATLACERNTWGTNGVLDKTIVCADVSGIATWVDQTSAVAYSGNYGCTDFACKVDIDGMITVDGATTPYKPMQVPTYVVLDTAVSLFCPEGQHSVAFMKCAASGWDVAGGSLDELKCIPSVCPSAAIGPKDANMLDMSAAVVAAGLPLNAEFAYECEPGYRSTGGYRCVYNDNALHFGVKIENVGDPACVDAIGDVCTINPSTHFRSHHFDFKSDAEDDLLDMLWTEDAQCRYVPPVNIAASQLFPRYDSASIVANKFTRWQWNAPVNAVIAFLCPAGLRPAVLLEDEEDFIFVDSTVAYNVSCGADKKWHYYNKEVVSMTCLAVQCPAISRLLQRFTETSRIDPSNQIAVSFNKVITSSWDLAAMTAPQPLGTVMQVACRTGFSSSLAGLTCLHKNGDSFFVNSVPFVNQTRQPTWAFNDADEPTDAESTFKKLESMCGPNYCLLDGFKSTNTLTTFTAPMLAGADHARVFKGVVAAGANVDVACPAFSFPTVTRMTCVNKDVGFVAANTITPVEVKDLCGKTCPAYVPFALADGTEDRRILSYYTTDTATEASLIPNAATRAYTALDQLPQAVKITCEPGYALYDADTIVSLGFALDTCTAGAWSNTGSFNCKPNFCEPPVIEGVDVALAKNHSDNANVGVSPTAMPSNAAVWTATCPDHMGFAGTAISTSPKSVKLTCATAGTARAWQVNDVGSYTKFTPDVLSCKYVSCPLPGSIDAGAYTLEAATHSANMAVVIDFDGENTHNEFEPTDKITAACAPGYGMVGQPVALSQVTLSCNATTGRFVMDKPLPVGTACVPVTCPANIATLAPATLQFNLATGVDAAALPASLRSQGSLIGLSECPATTVPQVVANPYNVKCEHYYDVNTGLLSAVGQWVKVKLDVPSFAQPGCTDCAPAADVETRCVPVECAVPVATDAVSYTKLVNMDAELVARVTCAPGYTRVRTVPEFIECFRGAWSADLTGPVCVPTPTATVSCAAADFSASGVKVSATGSVGTVVAAECIDSGAYFVNNTVLVECSAAGVWGPAHSVAGVNNVAFPQCRMKTCFALDKLRTTSDEEIIFSDIQTAVYESNAQSVLHDMTEYPHTTVANIVCKQGYVLEGTGRYTCNAGTWTGVGSCVPKLHVKEARLMSGGEIHIDFLGSTAKLQFGATSGANTDKTATEHKFVGALGCDALFPAASYQFGTGATCVFEPHRITIKLGTGFGLRGHPIALNGAKIFSAEVAGMKLAKDNADKLVYVPLVDATHELQVHYADAGEVATTCGGWQLDASSSTGAIGLSLAYGFELISGTPKQKHDFAALVKTQAPVVNVNFAGGRSNQPVAKISLTAAQVKDIFDLSATAINTVRVSATNWVGSVSTADVIVSVLDNNLPSVRLSETAITMYESQIVTVTASATSSPCAAANSQVSLSWTYNGAVVSRSASLTISPATLGLQVGADQIQLTASQLGSVTATDDVIIWLPVTVLPAAPTIVINGVKCPVAGCTADLFYDGLTAPLVLDASKSFDPAFLPDGAAGLTFVWTCHATRGGLTAACGDFNLDGVYSAAAAELSVSPADLAALGAGAVTFTATVLKGGASSSANYIITLAAIGAGSVMGFSSVTGFAAPTAAATGIIFVNTVNAPLQIVASVPVGADSTLSSVWACPGVLAAPVTGVSALQLTAAQLAAATVSEFTCTVAFSFTDANQVFVAAPVQSIRILLNKAPATPVCASELSGDEHKIVCSTNKPAEDGHFKFEQSIRGALTTVASNSKGEYAAALGAGSHRFQITFIDKYGASASTSYAIAGEASANTASRLAEAVHSQDAVAMVQSISSIAVSLESSNDAVNATKTRKDLFNSLNSNLVAFNQFDALTQASIQGSSTAIGVLASISDAVQSDAELRKSTLNLARSLASGLSKSVGVSTAAAESLHSIADDAIRAAAVQSDNVENIAILKAFIELAQQVAFSAKTTGKTSAEFKSVASTVKYLRVTTSSAAAAFANGDVTVSADLFNSLAAAGETHVDAVMTTITAPEFIANIGGSAGSDSASSIVSLSFYTADGTPVDTSSISEVFVTLKHDAALRGALHSQLSCQFFKNDATEDAAKATEATTWSSAGCSVASFTETQTVCKCTHLTLFRSVAGSGVYEPVDWLPLNRSNLDDNRTPIFMIVVWIAVWIVFSVVAYLVDRSKKADAAKALVEQWTAGRSPIVAPLASDASTCDYIIKSTSLLLRDYHLLYSVFARNVLDNVSSTPRMFGAMVVYLTAFALNAMFWGGVDARTDLDNYGGVIFLAAVVMVFVSFMIKSLLNSTHHAVVKKFVYRYAYELVALHELGTSDFFPKKDHAKLRASLNPAHADLYRQVLQAKASGQTLELNSLLRQVVVLQESHVIETLASVGTASNGGALVSYVVLLAWAVGMCVLICAFGIQFGQTVGTTPGKWIGSSFATIAVEAFAVKPFIFFVMSLFSVCCASSRAESLPDDKRDRALTAYALDANVIAAMGKAAATSGHYYTVAHNESAPVAVVETHDDIHHI